MKKIAIIALTAVFSLASMTVNAQDNKREFSPYWFIQAQGGVQLPFTPGNRSDLLSPAFGLNFGRVVNPYMAVRIGAEGWKSKVQDINNSSAYNDFKYATGSFDAMLNVSNIFCQTKVHPLNFYVLGGVGVNWSDAFSTSSSKFAPNIRLGALLDAKVSKAVSLSLEYRLDNTSGNFNGRLTNSHDWYSSLYVGVAVNFGYKKKSVPVTEPEPAPAPVVKPEPAPVPAPVVEPEPQPEKKLENMKESIFFTIGKSTVKGEEEAKIAAAASWMKEHPTAVAVVTGYADKATGSAAINKKISEKRAIEVANKLKAAGVSADRITVDFKGDTVQPFSENNRNRVAIIVAEEK